MKINYFILSLFIILVSGCSKIIQPTYTNTEPKTFTKSYELSSQFGHKLKVEVDYVAKDLNNLNNGCVAQFILTNIGTKDFIKNERFPAGEINQNGIKFQNFYFDPVIIFEFTTSDGKKIEGKGDIWDILVGKSSSAEDVHIDAGLRTCVGEVIPIRIEYMKVFY